MKMEMSHKIWNGNSVVSKHSKSSLPMLIF